MSRRRTRATGSGLGMRPASGFYGRLVVVNALAFLCFLTTGVAFAAPGDLDPTFDGDGKLIARYAYSDYASALVLQPEGKTAVGGTSCSPTRNEYGDVDGTECGALLVRYRDDGSVDTDFGADGKAPAGIDGVGDLTAQADGKLVSVGSLDGDLALMRHSADGVPDADFGQGGTVVTGLNDGSSGSPSYGGISVGVQSDGKILAVGSAYSYSSRDRLALARYKPDGSLDESFGEGGKVVTNFEKGEDVSVSDAALTPDGGIVVAGSCRCGNPESTFAVMKFDANGSLDQSFGEDGKTHTFFGGGYYALAHTVAVQPDGKIVVAGHQVTSYDGEDKRLAMARYGADGALDRGFGRSGKVVKDFEGQADIVARDLALLPGGQIVVSGSYYGSGFNGFGLARYRAEGTLDRGFGDEGSVSTDFVGDASSRAYEQNASAVAFRADDSKLVTAGYALPPCSRTCSSELAMARYDATPSVDEPANAAPVARDDRASTDGNRRAELFVLRNDTDPDGDRLTVTRSTQGKHGSVRCAADGGCVYVKNRGYHGKDAFRYVVEDGEGGTDAATVRVRGQRRR